MVDFAVQVMKQDPSDEYGLGLMNDLWITCFVASGRIFFFQEFSYALPTTFL